jgi:hypothetical protein
MTHAVRAPKASVGEYRPPHPQSSACLNCDTPLTGPFCSACGQRDVPPYPTIGELARDAFWELSGWDGRFAATVRMLVLAPGRLTREFLEGRRARYISPLRLYLVASLAYFVLAAAAPAPVNHRVAVAGATIEVSPAGVVGAARDAREGRMTPQERDAALAEVARAPKLLRPVFRRAILDPTGFKRGMIENLPRVLFALVPVFALILSIFYRRRRYPEHLYFALHLHAFVFVALAAAALAKFTRLYSVTLVVDLAVALSIVMYTLSALRRVYGGSPLSTIAKAAASATLYLLAGSVGLIATVYWTALYS